MIVCFSKPATRLLAILLTALLLVPGSEAVAQSRLSRLVEPGSLADVLEEVTPAVVNIAVTSQAAANTNPLFNDPYFRRFFDLPQIPQQRPRMSAGSGVIVDAAKGYILTNHHVVDGATEIAVTLKDRRRFTAELVGTDKETDIALLKIDAPNLTAMQFGDSSKLRVGDSVVAIGNPFGLGQTVTSGIVSALGRSGLNIEGYEDFIQTDASINPGNSGGALATIDGKLVGINTAIIAPAGGNVGIGFAVPIDMASAVMKQLIEHGQVRRGRIGVSIQDLTPDLAEALGVKETYGAVVASVEENSPAARAGIQAGDIIVSVNGRAITSSADLRNRIGLSPADSKVEVAYLRDGKRHSVSMRVEADNGQRRGASAPGPDRLSGASFDEENGTVVVANVAAGSPAAQAGLTPGDVILAVNRQRVTSVAELTRALRAARGTIALDISRGGMRFLLVLR